MVRVVAVACPRGRLDRPGRIKTPINPIRTDTNPLVRHSGPMRALRVVRYRYRAQESEHSRELVRGVKRELITEPVKGSRTTHGGKARVIQQSRAMNNRDISTDITVRYYRC